MSDVVGQSTPSQDTQATAPSAPPSVPVYTPLANFQDPNWPVSTIMANEDTKEALPAASVSPTPLANTDVASPPDLANQAATESGQVVPSEISLDDSPQETTPSGNLANPPAEERPPVENIPSERPVSTSATNTQPSSNQANQVQSSPSESVSAISPVQTTSDMASIKPEPPNIPQEAPLANSETQKAEEIKPSSPKSSFGEIIRKDQPKSSINPPNSTTPSPSPKPKSSFGDILGNLNKEESEKENLSVEPTINIEPIEPPKPSLSSPKSDTVPTPPQSPMSPNISDLHKKANQRRLDKKQKNLDRIMLFIKETQTITNTDVQRLCRVSQSTATNYLTELEKKGQIKQTGIRGGAKYTL